MDLRFWYQIRDWLMLAGLLLLSGGLLLGRNQTMVESVRALSLSAFGSVEVRMQGLGRYLRALEENDRLRAENVLLASQVARAREARLENQKLRALLSLDNPSTQEVIAVKILSKDLTQQHNRFVIDAGTDDGVQDGMAVIDEAGVLGRVLQAEASRSTVLPYLNTEFRVAAKIQPLQALGIVRWPGERNDRLLMDHVVKTEPVEKGQVVVTSGMSGVFPEGYPIGVVDSVRGTPGQNNLEIFIRPTTLLSRAEFAFVVVNTEKP